MRPKHASSSRSVLGRLTRSWVLVHRADPPVVAAQTLPWCCRLLVGAPSHSPRLGFLKRLCLSDMGPEIIPKPLH